MQNSHVHKKKLIKKLKRKKNKVWTGYSVVPSKLVSYLNCNENFWISELKSELVDSKNDPGSHITVAKHKSSVGECLVARQVA